MRSRFRRRASSLFSTLANSILGDFNPTSTGATASVLKARVNGVFWVTNLRVVPYAHNTSGRYSTNLPLRSSNLVFNAALRVLMVTSACPLDYGCAGDE